MNMESYGLSPAVVSLVELRFIRHKTAWRGMRRWYGIVAKPHPSKFDQIGMFQAKRRGPPKGSGGRPRITDPAKMSERTRYRRQLEAATTQK